MTPEEFVNGLAGGGGMEFADDEPDYCPRHGWATDWIELATGELHLHHVECDVYAAKLGLPPLNPSTQDKPQEEK